MASCGGTSIRPFAGATEAAGSSNENGHLVVENFFGGGEVFGRRAGDDDGGVAFVNHFDELRGGDECGVGGDGASVQAGLRCSLGGASLQRQDA